MKKLLFIMNDLECGGAQKSLISLLETIDYSKYKVDLFLLKHRGEFIDSIPKDVNLLEEPKYYKYFDMPFGKSIKELLKKGKFKVAFIRLIVGLIFKLEKTPSVVEQKMWSYTKLILKDISGEYDAAIGFMERTPIYLCIDKVKAKKKIGWIHTDYNKVKIDKNIDERYIKKLNNIVTISEECSHILKDIFKESKEKIIVINNIVSEAVIKRLSKEEVEFINGDKCEFKIVSVGRVEPEKGFDMAVEACRHLKDKGLNVNWYIVGDGTQKERLKELAIKNNVEENFYILGVKQNPYPYVMESDVFVQPSIYEGKSISIDEAKILNKPIVVTNFNTAKYQIHDKKTGLISEMNSKSVADSIESLLVNKQEREKLSENLRKERLGNEIEIEKLYNII